MLNELFSLFIIEVTKRTTIVRGKLMLSNEIFNMARYCTLKTATRLLFQTDFTISTVPSPIAYLALAVEDRVNKIAGTSKVIVLIFMFFILL